MRFSSLLHAAVALLGLYAALAQAGTIDPARDLQQDGTQARKENLPILLIYTAGYCHYCDEVKTDVFNHIARDPAHRKRVLLREVRVDSNIPVVGFEGDTTDHHGFSKNRGIMIVPTLEFLDDAGLELSRPLVGASIPDFYGAYVDSGIARAIRNIRARQNPS
ncbi:MAG TPA: hypothetical protein DG761_11510 [Gammaproteobacteria bacterium]|jgi:thioredoxin-related protein|nr:hypothetical protein [Acidiferrobacteraceae bacterium]MDP6551648.1 thioredoxin family protein [Arenicellales bacterium]MDP6790632.1 thioredoxin family protein [Arenicellales bacterium]MDP6919190.1 thioredoxin family protein [Arenicellales bacterium]HCX88641.1 hypothetical protein [Gammaproteobacteria bacterium]|tara:strand:- start:1691 stop:2179 length:489 start_codon:yes stop_codon:yes gene_type:complete